MESSIAEFLKRESACELLPTLAQNNGYISELRLTHPEPQSCICNFPAEMEVCAGFCRRIEIFNHCLGQETYSHKDSNSLLNILAEGAIALSMTLSGDALFAS